MVLRFRSGDRLRGWRLVPARKREFRGDLEHRPFEDWQSGQAVDHGSGGAWPSDPCLKKTVIL